VTPPSGADRTGKEKWRQLPITGSGNRLAYGSGSPAVSVLPWTLVYESVCELGSPSACVLESQLVSGRVRQLVWLAASGLVSVCVGPWLAWLPGSVLGWLHRHDRPGEPSRREPVERAEERRNRYAGLARSPPPFLSRTVASEESRALVAALHPR